MEILMHVGAHRTATTTLQRMLQQNRTILREAGYGYWGPRRLRGGLFRGLYAGEDTVLPWEMGRAAKRVHLNLAAAEDRGLKGIIVSEENTLGTMGDMLEARRFFPGAGLRAKRFGEMFNGHELILCLGIRSYEEWWRSVLTFRMMKGSALPLPGLIPRMVGQKRRWRMVITEIARALPQARVVVWTHEVMGAWPDDVITGLLGRSLGLEGADEAHNASPDWDELQAFLIATGKDPSRLRVEDGAFAPFDADQRACLQDHYAADRAWLSAGADGLAVFLDEAGALTRGPTGHERGITHEGRNEARRLA